jgi:hypothetical protein
VLTIGSTTTIKSAVVAGVAPAVLSLDPPAKVPEFVGI